MFDIEKAIRGLRICYSRCTCSTDEHGGCPYGDESMVGCVDRLSLDAAYLSRQTSAILGSHERNCALCQFNGDCGDDCIYITAARLFGAVFGEGEHE